MADGGESSTDFTIGVVNTDHTNRHESLNTPSKLTEGLVKLYDAQWKTKENVVLTFTEFQKTTAAKFGEKLEDCPNSEWGWCGGTFPSRDYIATYWDGVKWQPKYQNGKFDIIWSDFGKYSGVVLWDESETKQVAYVSAHMPKKESKHTNPKKAYELLQAFATDFTQDKPDSVGFIVAGDFNATPEELTTKFSKLNLGMRTEDGPTTSAGRYLDNVLSSDAIKPINRQVHTDAIKLSHHPLTVQLELED